MLALALVFGLTSSAWAQTHFWFDIRDNTDTSGGKSKNYYLQQDITGGNVITPFINGQGGSFPGGPYMAGAEGDGAVLRIGPTHVDGFETSQANHAYPDFDNDQNLSTGDLWLYAYVDTKVNASDVISSIGVDFNLAPELGSVPGSKNQVGSLGYAWEGLWADTNAGTAAGYSDLSTPPNWLNAKAVKVPVSGATPAFDTTNAIVPSADPYRLGKLSVTAGARDTGTGKNHALQSTYAVRLGINELLITRVNTTDPGDETVSFGYVSGAYDTTTYNGSDDSADFSLHAADAYIHIIMKWDYNGDGLVNSVDLGSYGGAASAGGGVADQRTMYCFDCTGDRVINATDLGYYGAYAGASLP